MNAPLPLHSAASVEWYTPPEIIEAVRKTFGQGIKLDPASSAKVNEIVDAWNWYDEQQNGLTKTWYGPLFLNPPGKSKQNPGGQAVWWFKLVNEYFNAVSRAAPFSAIYLGFSLEILQTAQRYAVWQPLDFMHCIPKKRIKFISGDGKPMKSPTHGNIICCLSKDQAVLDRFFEEFSKFGYVGAGNR